MLNAKNILDSRGISHSKIKKGILLPEKPAPKKVYYSLEERQQKWWEEQTAFNNKYVDQICSWLKEYQSCIIGIDFDSKIIQMSLTYEKEPCMACLRMFAEVGGLILFPSGSSRLIIMPDWIFRKGNDGLWHSQLDVSWNKLIDEALNSSESHFKEYAKRFLDCLYEIDKGKTFILPLNR